MPGEPLWLEEDLDAALEYIEYEASLCPSCRQERHESYDEANRHNFRAHVIRCFACEVRDLKVNAYREDCNSDDDMAGVHFGVEHTLS